MSEELRLDEPLFRELLQTVEESVVVLDGQGKIRYVNYMEEGYCLDEVIGNDSSEFIHTKDAIHVTHGMCPDCGQDMVGGVREG